MAGPRVLAQHAGTGAQVDAYTSPAAPGGKGTVVSSIVFVGTSAASATAATARVRVAPAGAADAAVHELFPTLPVAVGEHRSFTEGITLAPGDVLRVLATTGVNVHVYGTEL
jgi:hypothetical protein